MGKFTEEQLELIINHPYKPNPDNWRLYEETETELILLHKRGRRLTIKKEVAK